MKNKKFLKGVGICLIILVVMWFAYAWIMSMLPGDPSSDNYSRGIKYLMNDTDFICGIYGTEILFRDGFQTLEISELTEEQIDMNHDYVYLIINDLDGSLELKDEDIRWLKQVSDQRPNFNFLYLGKNLKLFQEVWDDYGSAENSLSFGYVMSGSTRLQLGFWDTDINEICNTKKPELLGEVLVDTILKYVSAG